jgi:phosphoglycolate phosphatase
MAIMSIHGHACAVDAVLFDKDGTLIEFDPLWCGWAVSLTADLSEVSGVPVARFATAIGLDPGRLVHVPEGPLAVGTMHDLVVVLAHQLYDAGYPWGAARDAVARAMVAAEPALTDRAEIRTLPGARELLGRLADLGLRAGVVTSDDTPRAYEHLRLAALAEQVDVVVGADRVEDGGKPAPEGILLACRELGVPPDRVAMIGDSEGDMRAASAAGVAIGLQLTSASPHPSARSLTSLDEIHLTPQ